MKTLFLFAIFSLTCFAGMAASSLTCVNHRDTIKMKKLVKQIEKENLFVYDAPANTAPAVTFRKFADNAPTYDFLKMAMEGKSPIIRLYAFKAVAEKMDDLPAPLMMRFRNDTARVRVQYRDGIKEVPLNEIINSFLK